MIQKMCSVEINNRPSARDILASEVHKR